MANFTRSLKPNRFLIPKPIFNKGFVELLSIISSSYSNTFIIDVHFTLTTWINDRSKGRSLL